MAKEIKFTNDEVASLDQLRQDVANIFTKLGQLSIEKKRRVDEIETLEGELLNQHSNLQLEEQNMFKGLNEKYGDGNYEPTTNVFTPTEQPKKKDDIFIKDKNKKSPEKKKKLRKPTAILDSKKKPLLSSKKS